LLPGSPPVSVVQEQQGLADQENVVKVTDVACHILQCKVDKPCHLRFAQDDMT
jgi:hypothetical protein